MNLPVMRVRRWLERINRETPWSHNRASHPWVLRQARKVRRTGGVRAVDIRCGTGDLARRLPSATPRPRDPRRAEIPPR